jgi:hypothetical protein
VSGGGLAVILRDATEDELNADGSNVYVVLDLLGPGAGTVKGWGALCTPVGHIDRAEIEGYLCGGADRIGYTTRRDENEIEKAVELLKEATWRLEGAS